MASAMSLVRVRPKISLCGLSSLLAGGGRSLPNPKPSPLISLSRSFSTICHKASFENSTHQDPHYTYSGDINALIKEFNSLTTSFGLRMTELVADGLGPLETVNVRPETLEYWFPKELLHEIDHVLGFNLFVKQGCPPTIKYCMEDEKNMYIRLSIPGVDQAGLKLWVDYNEDHQKQLHFFGVAEPEIDPEFGDLDVAREYQFRLELPANYDAENTKYVIKNGIIWMVVPKFVPPFQVSNSSPPPLTFM